MSIYEYDEEAVLEMLAEEYREDGIEIGMERGMAQGRAEGRTEERTYMLSLITKMIEAGEADKVKLLSEDPDLLEEMRRKYLGEE